MRQIPRAFSLGSCVLSLLMGPSAVAEEVLATGADYPTVQLIGWSSDEQRYVFRTFSQGEGAGDPDMMPADERKAYEKMLAHNAKQKDAKGFCKGYLDSQGARFKGALNLVVYERDKQLETLPIQDEPRCTPPKVAAERLRAAKKRLAELGIELNRVGGDFDLEPDQRIDVTPKQQPPYAVEYVDNVEDLAEKRREQQEEDTDPSAIELSGTLELYVHRGGKKQKLYSQEVRRLGSLNGAGMTEEGLASLHVSPSGERLVVVHAERSGDMRSGFTAALKVAAMLGVTEAPLPKAK